MCLPIVPSCNDTRWILEGTALAFFGTNRFRWAFDFARAKSTLLCKAVLNPASGIQMRLGGGVAGYNRTGAMR